MIYYVFSLFLSTFTPIFLLLNYYMMLTHTRLEVAWGLAGCFKGRSLQTKINRFEVLWV